MKGTIRERESGQVLLILMVGMVALLGFAALAIDGGMYFSDRRFDQNAADSAAFAGAGAAANTLEQYTVNRASFSCGNSNVITAINDAEAAAIQRAAANGFTIDTDVSDQHGVQVTCQDAGGPNGKYLYIEVWITSETKTSFAHLLFNSNMQNTTEAASRVIPGTTGACADGYAILALGECCNCGDGGVTALGNVDINVISGGIFSNACINKSGNSGFIYATHGVYYNTDLNDPHNKYQPTPVKVSNIITMSVPPPDCDGVPVLTAPTHGGTIDPGRYSSITLTGNGDLVLNPGLYCLTGEFKVRNGTLSINGSDDEGVTIYLGTTGSFDTAGNVQVQLRAPREGTTGTPPAIPGMLIYMAEGNTNEIDFGGTSDSFYRGTIFSPSGTIDMGGNSSLAGSQSTQVVGYEVVVHGNPGMTIDFNPGDLYQQDLPTLLDLFK